MALLHIDQPFRLIDHVGRDRAGTRRLRAQHCSLCHRSFNQPFRIASCDSSNPFNHLATDAYYLGILPSAAIMSAVPDSIDYQSHASNH
jgi:hypothetical protein